MVHIRVIVRILIMIIFGINLSKKNIDRIYYSEKYEVYYSIFKDNLKRIIIGYE